ncbi:MAG: branched-chain amino acid ABC transporter permease [Desulfobacteraceae bacterium]|nr:MAG: branched-chain amino acid ABC transporter permease [Desulfobacteraceae bacterium]
MDRSELSPLSRYSIVNSALRGFFADVPALGWLFGMLCAVLIEYLWGDMLAVMIYLPKVPPLFGATLVLKKPQLFPSALLYVFLVYLIPISAVARFSAGMANRAARFMERLPTLLSALIHLILLYAILDIWTVASDYRLQVAKLVMIAVMLTLSINVINGYMGEFSCSHPGFMALGAYVSSVFTLVLFRADRLFGPSVLPEAWGPFFFPAALIIGGVAASLGALIVAVPSFRTRGDYLAIISLAFLFIVKSAVENIEAVGGPRGLGGQPHWSSLLAVFAGMVVCIWMINNFVSSTLGKALNAVRDNEIAADAMTINTRRTKMVAFLFGAFWAGVAGGFYAHEVRHVTPGSFGIPMLAEILAMVYFGGLNSVIGSIVGAVSISMISEILKPLGLYKWMVIPLILILVMIFRPTGLVAFRDFDIKHILRAKR